MRLKTIITVALIGTIYFIIVSIMAYAGMFANIANIVEACGYASNSSNAITIDSTQFILRIPYFVCFLIFYSAFVWKIKSLARKWVGNIAFAVWCLALIFIFKDILASAYLSFHFSGETVMPISYWQEHERMGYFLFFSFNIRALRMTVELLSYFALTGIFISLWKRDKTMSVVGIIAMMACMLSFLPYSQSLPCFYLIYQLGWALLFGVALWRISHMERLQAACK